MFILVISLCKYINIVLLTYYVMMAYLRLGTIIYWSPVAQKIVCGPTQAWYKGAGFEMFDLYVNA
jgi:hypothetical protein